MEVVFTDLDGTLLDPVTYAWEPARDALRALKAAGIPVVFVTSKTRAEVEYWREVLENRDPFVVENGGAVVVPPGYFDAPGEEVIRLGDPYPDVVAALEAAAAESGARVLGFRHMTAAEVASACGLSPGMAELARLREYDEPFQLLEGEFEPLERAIVRRGKRCVRGGSFHHIAGGGDKGEAVRLLTKRYRDFAGEVVTLGVGDNWNDVPFLRVTGSGILMDSPAAPGLRAVLPNARQAGPSGPRAWAEAVLEAVAHGCR